MAARCREVDRRLRAQWGEALHSVYIRGSLAKGRAVAGYSDLDSFGVLRAGVDEGDSGEWARSLEAEIVQSFPIVAGVEFGIVPLEEIPDSTNIYAFIVKTEAACLYGESFAERLEPYRITPDIAFQTQWFGRHLALFWREYTDETEAERPDFIVWLMRRFLRLGMKLVMIGEERLTRDLYFCYESFAKHYPEQERSMYRALELVINPEAGPETEGFIRHFGDWLERESERKLAAWAQ